MDVNRERLADCFTELCEIDSPSRREGRICKRQRQGIRLLPCDAAVVTLPRCGIIQHRRIEIGHDIAGTR